MVRYKNRYIILYMKARDGRPHDGIGGVLPAALRAAVLAQHGESVLSAASPGLSVLFYHHLAGVAIVRVPRSEHVKVLASCLRLSVLDGRSMAPVRLLKLTGTLRVAKRDAKLHVERLLQLTPPGAQHTPALEALRERLDCLC